MLDMNIDGWLYPQPHLTVMRCKVLISSRQLGVYLLGLGAFARVVDW